MKYKIANNKREVLQAGGLLLTRRSDDATPNRGLDYWSTNDPEEIRRFLESQQYGSRSSFEYFNFSSWNHATDAEFARGLTFNDETNMFHTSYVTKEGDDYVVTGVSIPAFREEKRPSFH